MIYNPILFTWFKILLESLTDVFKSIHNEDTCFIRKFRLFAGKINKIEQNYKDDKLNRYFGFPFNLFGYFLGVDYLDFYSSDYKSISGKMKLQRN